MPILMLKTVLVGVDLDDASLIGLKAGRALAATAGAKLHIVHVSDSDATDAVHAALNRVGLRPGDAPVHVVTGDPGPTISALGKEIGADVIVIGPHRDHEPTKRARQLGPTAISIVTNASAPCLALAHPLRLPLERVVVAIDLSDTSRGALLVGLSWASALRSPKRRSANGTKLIAFHVHRSKAPEEESASKRALEEELVRVERDAGEWAGVTIERATMASESPEDAIAEFARAKNADLVILGTRGDGLDAISRLGSVSAAVTKRLELPTLLVPPAVWAAYADTASRHGSHAK